MLGYRHAAYNLTTGVFLIANSGNQLKKEVVRANRFAIKIWGAKGQWRWSHDFGKDWYTNGLPSKSGKRNPIYEFEL